MKKIIKNGRVVQVTDGAFKQIFKDKGWKVLEEKKQEKEKKQELTNEEKEALELEKQLEVLLEKPLGNWSAKEVKLFAEANDIDITGTKNSNEAKEIIKEYLV